MKGAISINMLIVALILGFLAFKMMAPAELINGYHGYSTCQLTNTNVCAGKDISNQVNYGQSFIPRTSLSGKEIKLSDLPYASKNINYNKSYCTITFNNNPFGAPGDICNGIKCNLVYTHKLTKTPYGPACPVKSSEYYKLSIPDKQFCCTANPEWTINQIYGIKSIRFHIVENPTPLTQNNTLATQKPLGSSSKSYSIWQSITSFFNNIVRWFFGG